MTNDAPSPADRLASIVDQALCIGCGLCESVAGRDTVRMVVTPERWLLPEVVGDLTHETMDVIDDVCPGTRVDGLPDRLAEGGTIDPVWGPWRRMVRAWAGDPQVRHVGSTGGVLTALAQFLLDDGRVDFVLHATASSLEPSFGEPTLSFTSAEVLEAAGSRYGPTPTLLDVNTVLDRGQPFAFVGTPCDVSALRNHARHDPRVDELVRYNLTMVCGGFGTPEFTDGFLGRIGIERDEVTSLRYRGFGCPGPTRVETADRVEEVHYLDFWGEDDSQWSLPWRCKICPDGIGEAADIAASDTWPGGSPTREESETDLGVNAIIARTDAGAELLAAAASAGALTIERDIGPDDMSEYQPHQVRKKQAAADRHAAIGDAGRIVPVTNGLRIEELAAAVPVEVRERQRSGTRDRIAAGKATLRSP